MIKSYENVKEYFNFINKLFKTIYLAFKILSSKKIINSFKFKYKYYPRLE